MNSKPKYQNYISKHSGSSVRRIGIAVLSVIGVVLVGYVISSLVNYVQVREQGQQSRFGYVAHQPRWEQDQAASGRVNSAVAPAPSADSSVKALDFRAYVLDEYFRVHNSPLYGTGRIFVNSCDRHGALGDCTTVAAIAHAETDLCKYHNSAEYHNCWGFGGGGEHRIYFDSWVESIDTVTERLVNAYGLKYMRDPSLMEETFCGDEPGCTGWGNRVKYFMNKINKFPKQLGFNKTMNSFR